MANGSTTNFGWSTVGASGSLAEDGYKALVADRVDMDALVYAIMNHHHTGVVVTGDTVGDPPELTSDAGSGGFAGGQTLYYAVSLIDDTGREGAPSPTAEIELPGQIDPPDIPDLPVVETTGGTLGAGTYQYTLSAYINGDPSLETTPSPAVYANVVGTTTGKVTLTYPALPSGANGWNIYRYSPSSLDFLKIRALSDELATLEGGEFIDDGSWTEDTNSRLPTANNTSSANSVTITYPDPPITAGYQWRIYRTSSFGLWDSSLVTTLDAADTEFIDIGYETISGAPYGTSTEITQPDQIDLATEATGNLPWIRIGDAANYVTQSSGDLDFTLVGKAMTYYAAISGASDIYFPPYDEERSFTMVLNPSGTSLPATDWHILDGATVTDITPVWYTDDPFDGGVIGADGAAIKVFVVQSDSGDWHYGLAWLNGGGGGGGSSYVGTTVIDESASSYPLTADLTGIASATVTLVVPNASSSEELTLDLPDPSTSPEFTIILLSASGDLPLVSNINYTGISLNPFNVFEIAEPRDQIIIRCTPLNSGSDLWALTVEPPLGKMGFPVAPSIVDLTGSGPNYTLTTDLTDNASSGILILVDSAGTTGSLEITAPDTADARTPITIAVLAASGSGVGPVITWAASPTVNVANPFHLAKEPVQSFKLTPVAGTWGGVWEPNGTSSIGDPYAIYVPPARIISLNGDYGADVQSILLEDDIEGWDLPTDGPRPGAVTHVYTQDSFGPRVLTSDNAGTATIIWVGGVMPTLSTTAANTDIIRFTQISADTYLGELVASDITI